MFRMITFDARDEMLVRDQNGSVVLRTPCIGTNRILEVAQICEQGGLDIYDTCAIRGGDLNGVKCTFGETELTRACVFTDGWNCNVDTGICSKPFEYGGGSQLTVEVTPNCGDTTDTVWAFEVKCP